MSEPLLFHRSKGYNPDFGAYHEYKCYLEWRSPYLYSVMQAIKTVFEDYEESDPVKNPHAEKAAIEALKKVIAAAERGYNN